MNRLAIIISILILLLLQSIGSKLLFPYVVNLLLVFALMFSIFGSLKETVVVSLVSGILIDFASGLTDGVFITSMLISSLTIYFVVNWVLKKGDLKIVFGAVTVGSILFFGTTFFMSWFLKQIGLNLPNSMSLSLKEFVVDIMLNFLFAYPVLLYFGFLEKISPLSANK